MGQQDIEINNDPLTNSPDSDDVIDHVPSDILQFLELNGVGTHTYQCQIKRSLGARNLQNWRPHRPKCKNDCSYRNRLQQPTAKGT